MPSKAEFRVWRAGTAKGKRWYWNLLQTQNGRVICAGQPSGYATKQSAYRGIEALRHAVKADAEIVYLSDRWVELAEKLISLQHHQHNEDG